jgi:hypothetical protein
MSLATRVPAVRRWTESVLGSYYIKAERQGLHSITLPAWYRWLRAYYFAAIKTRLTNVEFQKKYWEIGSLGDYQRFLATESDRRTQAFLELVLQQLKAAQAAKQAPVRMLEVGCGDGMTMRFVSDRLDVSQVTAIVGIDISHSGIVFARHHAGGRARLVQASIGAIPFSRRFDVACWRGVLLYLDPAAVRGAMREVAMLCDRLVIAEPAVVGRDTIALECLTTSINREDLDQTTWVHPYPKLVTELGGRVVRSEIVDGNCLLVIEWPHQEGTV